MPEDSGLWKDSQMKPLREVVEFTHSQGQNTRFTLGMLGGKLQLLLCDFHFTALRQKRCIEF
jgi:2,4-dienoyl-CoA reductase-like NADH-dependent reductase (Old Yellow Enzyme family)